MKIFRVCLFAILSLPVLVWAQTAGPTPAASAPASITVDAASSPGPVNRLVFGQNLEAADNARIFSSDKTDLNTIQTGMGVWNPGMQAPVPAILERVRAAGVGLLRYPGGSMVCNYDWRKAVGPLQTRGDWKFGVDEYLALCQAAGAEPMFTVSDYVLPADQMPAYAAGLVEYLNAPATPDHPWAMKRKEWGHPVPYGVKWFELGNESATGNMRVIPHRVYTPEEYAAYANACAAAMRKVDPTIKIGIVTVPGPGIDVDCRWNRTVVRLAGKSADYLIVHLYGPEVGKNVPDPNFLQTLMAVGEQSAVHLDDFRALTLRESGRELPIAVTEYNGPCPDRAPSRFSYGVALECADLLRIFLQPEHHVLTASYWELLNGAFGILKSDRFAPDGGTVEEKPAYTLYRLWAEHLGTQLATVHVDGPRVPFEGAGSVYPAAGDTSVPSHSLGQVPTDGRFKLGTITPGITVDGGTGGAFSVRVDGVAGKFYAQLALFPKPEATGPCDYEVTFEARFTPDAGNEMVPPALGIGDSRGWQETRSAIIMDGIGKEWQTFQAHYHALPDTTALGLLARRDVGSAHSSGRLEVRNFKIEAFSFPIFPAYALLTACATLSEDGKTLHLIVFNKSAAQDIPAQLNLAGFHAASASIWQVNGPDLGALAGVAEIVHGAPLDMTDPQTVHLFPAHSMTAIDFVAQANP